MNKFFTDLQKQARMIRLSIEEKQSMRMHLYKVIEASPTLSGAQKSAMQDFKNRKVSSMPSMYHWFSPRFSVPVAILLLVGLSGGTAFAAQSALPGEPLYAIKTQVNEPVAVALATTPAAKAEVNASIATTRLEEAETLAANGTLTASTTAELASNFAEHASAAQANTVAVAAADPGTAAQLDTTFSSTLAAHSAILAQLATDAGTSSVQANSDALAVQVLTQAVQGQQDVQDATQQAVAEGAPAVVVAVAASTSTPDAIAPASAPAVAVSVAAQLPQAAPAPSTIAPADASSTVRSNFRINKKIMPAVATTSPQKNEGDGVVALALATEASSTLSQAEADFATLAPSLDASTTIQIQAQLDAASQLLAQGNNALIAGDNSSAKDALSRVLRMSVRLDAFLKAGKKFNPAFLTSLLK